MCKFVVAARCLKPHQKWHRCRSREHLPRFGTCLHVRLRANLPVLPLPLHSVFDLASVCVLFEGAKVHLAGRPISRKPSHGYRLVSGKPSHGPAGTVVARPVSARRPAAVDELDMQMLRACITTYCTAAAASINATIPSGKRSRRVRCSKLASFVSPAARTSTVITLLRPI